MIMYALVMVFTFLGFFFFVFGFYTEIELFNLINPYLNSPGYLPMSLGYFLVSIIFMFIAIVFVFYRIKSSGCGKRFDRIDRNKGLFNFIYRDGISVDLIGKRRIGMGIFDIPDLGIIMDAGRLPSPGSVYRFGDKNIRFALQDIHFTPNPKYTNIYTFFTDLGINNANELKDILNGYNPELMAKVWNRLCSYTPRDSADKIVDYIRDMDKKDLSTINREWKKESSINHNLIRDLIDKMR